MDDTRRWVLVVVAVLLISGLIAYARGPVHHRGNQVGTKLGHPVQVTVVAPAPA